MGECEACDSAYCIGLECQEPDIQDEGSDLI